MDPACEMLEKCGFFKKYQTGRSAACQGFIRSYCEGPLQARCERKKYRLQYGVPPSDDMLPSGKIVKLSFQSDEEISR